MPLILPFQESPLQSPGAGDSAIIYILEIVILLLGAFILGWLISYLTYRVRKNRINEMAIKMESQEQSISELIRENERIQKELLNIQIEKSELEEQQTKSVVENPDLVSGIWEDKAPVVFQNQPGENTESNPVQTANNLTHINGIDDQVELLLNDAGIHSLVHLANCSVSHIKKLLQNAGEEFQDYNPESWPGEAANYLKNHK